VRGVLPQVPSNLQPNQQVSSTLHMQTQ